MTNLLPSGVGWGLASAADMRSCCESPSLRDRGLSNDARSVFSRELSFLFEVRPGSDIWEPGAEPVSIRELSILWEPLVESKGCDCSEAAMGLVTTGRLARVTAPVKGKLDNND